MRISEDGIIRKCKGCSAELPPSDSKRVWCSNECCQAHRVYGKNRDLPFSQRKRMCQCCNRRRILTPRRVLVGPGHGKLGVPENVLLECDDCRTIHETYKVSVFHLSEANLAFLVGRLGEHGTYDYLYRNYADVIFHRRIYAFRLAEPRRRRLKMAA